MTSPHSALKVWVLSLLGGAAVVIVATCWGLTDRAVGKAEASTHAVESDLKEHEAEDAARFERIDGKLDQILLRLAK